MAKKSSKISQVNPPYSFVSGAQFYSPIVGTCVNKDSHRNILSTIYSSHETWSYTQDDRSIVLPHKYTHADLQLIQ